MRKYYVHPVYNLYGAARDGSIICLKTKNIMMGCKSISGYLYISVRSAKNKKQKTYRAHKFIYECCIGKIPNGYQVDHINSDTIDNRLINLQLLTPSENSRKGNTGRGSKIRVAVRAKNLDTGQEIIFQSMNSAGRELNICVRSICRVKDKISKSAYSKRDQSRWYFEVVINQ